MSDSAKPTAFSAARWVIMGTFGFRLLAYVGQVIILRSITPDVFGAYRSLVDVHLMALPLFPFAIDALLIREKLRRRRFAIALSLTLALLGVLAVVGTLACVLLPGPGEASFAQSLMAPTADWTAIALMAPIFAVMATKLSVRCLLAADMDFRRISLGEFGNGLFTYFGGAAAVLFIPTVWPLMAAFLLGEIFECWYFYRRFPFRLRILHPKRWPVGLAIMRRHWSFCLMNSVDLTINNVGSLLPAPLLLAYISAAAAADFGVARMLIQLPILLLAGAIWRVAYPTISGVSEEVLQDRCLKIIGTAAAFMVPAVLWLASFAPSTAMLLGGEKYAGSAALVQWMAIYMAFTAVYSPISTLDMIRDRSSWGLAWNVVHTASRVWVILAFEAEGVLAVVKAISITSMVLWFVWAVMLGVLVRCGLWVFFLRVFKFTPLWLLLGGAFWGCSLIDGGRLWLGPVLSAVPGLMYVAVVWRFFPQESAMLRRLLNTRS
jgi:O-antigen/teichoic acid export membrane protein